MQILARVCINNNIFFCIFCILFSLFFLFTHTHTQTHCIPFLSFSLHLFLFPSSSCSQKKLDMLFVRKSVDTCKWMDTRRRRKPVVDKLPYLVFWNETKLSCPMRTKCRMSVKYYCRIPLFLEVLIVFSVLLALEMRENLCAHKMLYICTTSVHFNAYIELSCYY